MLTLWALFCAPAPVLASAISLDDLYINPINQHLPEVIILHNSTNFCEHCAQAIDEIITILKQNYRHKVTAYLVDAAKHPEFATAFHAYDPLSLIVIRINDGAAFGYEKLTGLESEISSPEELTHRVTEFINNFLSFN